MNNNGFEQWIIALRDMLVELTKEPDTPIMGDTRYEKSLAQWNLTGERYCGDGCGAKVFGYYRDRNRASPTYAMLLPRIYLHGHSSRTNRKKSV